MLDDQPVWLKTRGKPIVNIPYTQECNDVAMMLIQHHKASEFYERAIDQFEQIYKDAKDGARIMAISRASLHHGRAAPHQILPQDFREDQEETRRAVLERLANPRLVSQGRPQGPGVRMASQLYRSAFVPHDIERPISGAPGGPLAGLTAVVKDMYGIAGEVAGCGNPRWLETHQPATQNCPAVQKLIDAGATITGKTICDEFFFSVSGINAHYGAPVNARAPGRIPGGSSSGSAAAVGANVADIALGSDTGGSVRVPASFNGIYGLRPTHGRIDSTGVQDMAPSLDVPGFFAATPGVFRNVGGVLLDERRIPAKIKRVVVLEDAFAEADPEIDDLLRTLIELMSDDLPAMTHAKISPDGLEPWRETFRIVQAAEVWQTFGAWVARENPEIGPGVKERMAFAASVTKPQHDAASAARAQMREHVFQIVTARHHPGAADIAVHRAAARYRRRRRREIPRPRTAANLHRQPQRAAAGLDPRGDGCGLPDRAVVHRLGRRRRGAARSVLCTVPPSRNGGLRRFVL